MIGQGLRSQLEARIRNQSNTIEYWERQAMLLGHDGEHDPWKPCPECGGTGKVWQPGDSWRPNPTGECPTCTDRPGLVRDTDHYNWAWLCVDEMGKPAQVNRCFYDPDRDHPTVRCGWVLLGTKPQPV